MSHSFSKSPDMTISHRSSNNCERLIDLGYVAGKHVTLYGEHFEIASDPFIDGNWVAVRAFSENDPAIQTIRLPVSILLGLTYSLPRHVS
jgi:hypothetical protein